MIFVGITGGVGAGKSAVLDYIERMPEARVMLTDAVAHDLMEPGTECYENIRSTFPGADIYLSDGHFDRKKLAAFIFRDEGKRLQLNGIVHPAVKKYVIEEHRKAQAEGKLKLLVVEAALLIEEGYDRICDELWYIYTSEEKRRARLIESRGYSNEKISGIFASQLPEADFRKACRETIDNNGTIEETQAQIREILLARGIEVSI